ncbi:MAG: MurR/RpiR family transcriptional regulator [Blautia sp.]|jgi:DNA-binding MurR/RpiR family transcriptional regulator
MIENGCKDKILSKMHSFTNTERKIAEYVLSHYEEVLNCNITELSENAKVSDASVVRFCRSIGYRGYQDFKVNAARDVLPRGRHFNPALQEHDDPATICGKIIDSEISVLNRTLLGLDMKKVEKAADLIYKAGKIVLFGSGGSLLVGKDALHKLLKIGIRAYVYEDMDLQLMASSLLEEKDVAIGISHSGSNCGVLKCLENAKENGAFAIALTGRGKTPIFNIADVAIETASEQTIFQSESVSTRIAQLAIIDVLTAIAAFKNYDASYLAIQKTRLATSENKF